MTGFLIRNLSGSIHTYINIYMNVYTYIYISTYTYIFNMVLEKYGYKKFLEIKIINDKYTQKSITLRTKQKFNN